jgi:putative OPT family oligopeptide transporter
MSIVTILAGVVIGAIAVAIFFGTLRPSIPVLLIGFLLTMAFSFFFTSVAANAIATTARNPVSGMTMLTIIISSAVLLQFGVSGTTGMFFVMAIAGMVCTALSVSGQTVTDLKAGYWIGSTPAKQELVKFLGVIAAAIAVGLTIVMLAQTYQFGQAVPGDTRQVLPAPQASIMQALVEGFMNRQPIAYILFLAGAFVAVAMELLGVPALIFALGMYLPLELNTPALVGGFIAHLVQKKSERVGGDDGRRLRERAVVIASGLMAGGALGGVFGAALRLKNIFPWYREDLIKTPFYDADVTTSIVSLVAFFGLCMYLWLESNRKGKAA